MAKKNSAQISLFPETLYEYHVLLSPGDAIIEDVDKLKQQLHEMISIPEHNLKSLAHITLMKIEGYDSMNLPAQIKAAVAGERKFTIKLAGCDKFESGSERTLYIKVENPEPIDHIAAIIKPGSKRKPQKRDRQISILDKPGQKPKIPTITPHVTIARNIPAQDYDRIDDFTSFDYQGEFVCDKILVRRRIAGSNKTFSPYATIKLG
jgi:2'-5' RNA ligase